MEEVGRGQLIVLLVVHIHRQSQVPALPLANHEAHVQFHPSRVRLLDHDTVEGLLPVCKCWNVKGRSDVFTLRCLTLSLLLGVRANRDPDQFIRVRWVPTAFRLICVVSGQIVPTSVSAATAIHLEEAQDGRAEVHALVVQCRGRRVEVQIERIVIGTKNVQNRSHGRTHGVDGNVMDRLRVMVGTRVRGIVDHDHHADFLADRLQGQSGKGQGETQNVIRII